ncbi:MAG: hypothetical protein H7Z75_10480 [Ferruginibacter sp.]|nr:hypothetical protein [Cytophagales bacterium]
MSRSVYHWLTLLALPILLTTVTSVRAQGLVDGFMRGAGKTTVALSYSHESYRTYFVGNRPSTNTAFGTITTRSVNLFAAAGLTDYLDAVVALPYASATPSVGNLASQSGLQDVSLYLKLRPYQVEGKYGKLTTILAGGISTPLSDYIADFPIAIGHQSTNLDGRALVQYANYGVFAMVQGGYTRRSNVTLDRGFDVRVPNTADLVVKVGFSAKHFYADGWLNRQVATQDGTDIGPGVSFPSNAISFTRVGYTLYAPVPKLPALGVSFGMGFTLHGENVGKATRYSGGLVYNLPSWKKDG